MNSHIGIDSARLCNETDRELRIGDLVVINQGSRQVLAVCRSELEASIAAAEISESDIETEIAEVI